MKDTAFYHGGGCASILEYFKQRPIQLGTRWIFILDGDAPAESVKSFISNKYKGYIDKDIFIFQYDKAAGNGASYELEDLLPGEVLEEVAKKVVGQSVQLPHGVFNQERGFAVCFGELVQKYARSEREVIEFKERFKETLNDYLEGRLKDVGNMDQLTDFVPEYVAWMSGVVETLKSMK